uniref:Uncharacterized protein n=1 Tax=Wuchereria bancrofti TaxID=6293 RepID=A0AAF5Q6K9_WUCBA
MLVARLSREAEHGESAESATTAAVAALPRQQQRYVDVRCAADTRAHAPPDQHHNYYLRQHPRLWWH